MVESIAAAKTETLVDAFGALNTTTRWSIFGTGPAVSSGRLGIPAATSYPYIASQVGYDLRASSLTIRATPPNPLPSPSLAIGLVPITAGIGSRLEFGKEGSVFYMRVAASVTTVAHVASHKYMRIRLVTTTVHFETSPDGRTWTSRRTATVDPALYSNVEVRLSAGNWGGLSNATAGTAYFDQLNTPEAEQSLVAEWGEPLTMTGTDPDGPISSRTFTQISGSTVTLSGTGVSRTFTTTDSDTLVFEYTVLDPDGSSTIETITVEVIGFTEFLASGSEWIPMQVIPL